jgi:hypothetical protein
VPKSRNLPRKLGAIQIQTQSIVVNTEFGLAIRTFNSPTSPTSRVLGGPVGTQGFPPAARSSASTQDEVLEASPELRPKPLSPFEGKCHRPVDRSDVNIGCFTYPISSSKSPRSHRLLLGIRPSKTLFSGLGSRNEARFVSGPIELLAIVQTEEVRPDRQSPHECFPWIILLVGT